MFEWYLRDHWFRVYLLIIILIYTKYIAQYITQYICNKKLIKITVQLKARVNYNKLINMWRASLNLLMTTTNPFPNMTSATGSIKCIIHNCWVVFSMQQWVQRKKKREKKKIKDSNFPMSPLNFDSGRASGFCPCDHSSLTWQGACQSQVLILIQKESGFYPNDKHKTTKSTLCQLSQ